MADRETGENVLAQGRPQELDFHPQDDASSLPILSRQ